MQLFILRHAIAADRAAYESDADRPLTALGIETLERVTTAFPPLSVVPTVIICSPLLRARQTAEVVGRATGVSLQIEDALAAGAEPDAVLTALRERDLAHAPMLVGHEPDLSRLIATLIGGDDRARIRLKKSGLAALDVESLTPGGAELRWLMAPKQLRACAVAGSR